MEQRENDKNRILLKDNPFYILRAMPTDRPEELIGRAEELELLTGVKTEDAQNALLHPKLRLEAEIAYFPRTSEEQVEAVRSYLESAGIEKNESASDRYKGGGGPVPDFETSSVLAMYNGVNAFLAYWPVTDAASAAAACFCYAGIADHLSGREAMKELNADREEAGIELCENAYEVSGKLRNHMAQTADELGRRCAKLKMSEELEILTILADAYADTEGEYCRSPSLDALVLRHIGIRCTGAASQAASKVREIGEEYRTDAAKCEKDDLYSIVHYNNTRKYWRGLKLTELLNALDIWNRMTLPARRIAGFKGFTDKGAHELFEFTHSLLNFMNNKCRDYENACRLIRAIAEVFQDESPENRALVQKNLKIIEKNANVL